MQDKRQRRVRFAHRGLVRYGVVRSTSQEAQGLAERGELLVYDSILPLGVICKAASVIDVPIPDGGRDPYAAHIEREYRKAKYASDKLGLTCAKGKLLRFAVGQGYAYYIIVRVNKRSVRLEWRGFSTDRLVERSIGFQGSIPIERCRDMISAEEELRTLFPRGPMPGS